MTAKKVILCLFIVAVLIGMYSSAHGQEISKGAALNIAVKEVYERDYEIYYIYILKNETLWEKYPKSWFFRGKDVNDIDKIIRDKKYWYVYFSTNESTTDNDIVIFIDSTSGEILSIYGSNIRKRTKEYICNSSITMGEAVDIADKTAVSINYDIDGKYYRIRSNVPPWYGFRNESSVRTEIFRSKYPDAYNYFLSNRYWVIEYHSIKPTHDGGLKIYVNSETGEPFFKADDFIFSPN